MMKFLLAIVVMVVLLTQYCAAQGCSDAGFCTLGAMKLQQQDTTQQQLTFLLPAGIGDEGVFIFSPAIQYDRKLTNRWSMQARLSTNYAGGTLANTFGPGDLFLASTHTLKQTHWKVDFTLGIKIPLSDGNLKKGDLSLPMVYQSSLGTFDLISGISLKNSHWQFALGWQQPLTQQNNNEFIPASWNSAEAEKFLPTNQFERQSDALMRIAYTSKTYNRFSLTGGLLAIYHSDNDRYTNPDDNMPVAIDGSQGLTLNGTLLVSWAIHARAHITITVAAPFIAREARPDGLTRAFTFAPEIRWRF